MTARKWTISTIKKFFLKCKEWKDAADGFLTAFKWLLTFSGLVYTWYSTKTIMDKNTTIQQKNDTIKVKTDSIVTAKTVCAKAIDDNPDTAKKYKKLVKVFYMKQ